jgi:2-polyprenyl-3-methyl-5-hydroxy-6-metoxy-1,4-benzoquinol methylase
MDKELLLEGLTYAEQNYCSDDDTHLRYDKKIMLETFNLNGKKVLDFGCGMGSMLLWYKTNWDCDVHGIDIDENHIEVSKELFKRFNYDINVEVRNIKTNPITEKYDFISLNDVVEHIDINILGDILKQLEQSLTENGQIFISYPSWLGPFASHVDHVVGLPWCQFLPNSLLMYLIKKNNRKLVGSIESDLVEAYKSLNHLTHRKLMRLIKNHTTLELKTRKTHCFLNKIPFLKNVNFGWFPTSLLVTKEFLIFESKKSSK